MKIPGMDVRANSTENSEDKDNNPSMTDVRVKVTENGEINVSVDGRIAILNHTRVNILIDRLKTAQEDAKTMSEINRKRDVVLKNYNGLGRSIFEENDATVGEQPRCL